MIKRLDRFIPTAGDPEPYRTARKDSLEYKLLYGAMMQTLFAPDMDHWHAQGLWIITPSGKVIGGGNVVSEPAAIARELDKGLERYSKMSREERLLPKAPDPARDRALPAGPEAPHAPADGLILRMVSRGLPCEGMSPKDTRHEFFYKLDRVWYTRDEARGFLPKDLKIGARETVKRSVSNRLFRLYLGVFVQPNLYWQPEDMKESSLSTEIIALKEDSAEIRLSGRARAESASNKRVYEADLLGKATYRFKSQSFSAFELMAVGTLALGPSEHLEEGSPRTAPLGVLFTLNGKNSNDQVAPYFYRLYSWAGGD